MALMIAIWVFAIGEMAGSPKITEYIGRIAPADKKALYMGYSFIPVFLGNIFAGIISGPVYQNIADKVTIVQRFAAEKGFDIPEGLNQTEYFKEVAAYAGLTQDQLTQYLWDTYNPSNMWIVIMSIGLAATVALFIYNIYQTKSEQKAGK